MVIAILHDLLLFYALVLFLYCVYKVVWYAVIMLAFPVKMKRLGRNGIRVERLRGLAKTIFGRKGDPDYYMTVNGKRYEVCVLSFISIHGRWIFEMRTAKYGIEARRLRDHFYSEKKHRSMAGGTHEYRHEFRISRKELFLTPADGEYAGQILLLYPMPKRIVCVDHKYRELSSGEEMYGHTVMSFKDFAETVRKEAST